MKSIMSFFDNRWRRQPVAAPLEDSTFHTLSLDETTAVSGGRWGLTDAIVAGGIFMSVYDEVFPPIEPAGPSNYEYWTSQGVDMPPIK